MGQPLNKLAIVIGICTEIIGMLVTLVGIFAVMLGVLASRGEAFDEDTIDRWPNEPAFLISAFVIGTLTLVIAGFVTGKVAKRDHVRHAAWTGGIILVVYAILTFIPIEGPSEPLWYDVLSLLSTVPAVMAGGYLSIPKATG